MTIKSNGAPYRNFLLAPDELGRAAGGAFDYMRIRRNDPIRDEKAAAQAHRLPLRVAHF
jgi:hypothetical protein